MPFNPTIPAMVDDSVPGLGNGTPLNVAELDTNRFQKLIENDNYLHDMTSLTDGLGMVNFSNYALTSEEVAAIKIVDPSGNGDFLTINEAALANEGILSFVSGVTHAMTDHVYFHGVPGRVALMGPSGDDRAVIDLSSGFNIYFDKDDASVQRIYDATFTEGSDLVTGITDMTIVAVGDVLAQTDSVAGVYPIVTEIVDASTLRISPAWAAPTVTRSTVNFTDNSVRMDMALTKGTTEITLTKTVTTAELGHVVGMYLYLNESAGKIIGIKDATTFYMDRMWWGSDQGGSYFTNKAIDRPAFWNINFLTIDSYNSQLSYGKTRMPRYLSYINVGMDTGDDTTLTDYINYDGFDVETSLCYNMGIVAPYEMWPITHDFGYFYNAIFIDCDLPCTIYPGSYYYRTRFIPGPGATGTQLQVEIDTSWDSGGALNCELAHPDSYFISYFKATVIGCTYANGDEAKVYPLNYYGEDQSHTWTGDTLYTLEWDSFINLPRYVELDAGGFSPTYIRVASDTRYKRGDRLILKIKSTATPGGVVEIRDTSHAVLVVMNSTVGSWAELIYNGASFEYLTGTNI